ncbi:DUF6861 domain-containing protein [Bartonella sp. CR127HXZ]|uniref:DUF6861 domain-containing protein n=1 Tax=Bartonella TaxID=773 RepID=UPI0035CFFDC0
MIHTAVHIHQAHLINVVLVILCITIKRDKFIGGAIGGTIGFFAGEGVGVVPGASAGYKAGKVLGSAYGAHSKYKECFGSHK